MKKILVSTMLILSISANLFAQTAISNCNSVTCTGTQPYNTQLWGAFCGTKTTKNNCDIIIVSGSAWKPRYWLQQKQSNGSWVTVAGGSLGQYGNGTFNNLGHGTYQVQIQIPILADRCENGNIPICYDVMGNFIGYFGQYLTGLNAYTTMAHTNVVIVGATIPSDNVYSFADLNGTNNNTTAFDANEVAYIDFSQQKNYNGYFLAIFENGAPNRVYSATWAWVNGTLDANPPVGYNPTTKRLNLNQYWAQGGANWTFLPLNSYHVQFVNQNQSCSGYWNVNDQTFFICPNGSGCKPSDFEEKEISISTMPNGFLLNNIDLTKNNTLRIFSMDGRLIKEIKQLSSVNYSTKEYANGMYIVNVGTEGKKPFSGKIQVNN